jgi:hypothetical protein
MNRPDIITSSQQVAAHRQRRIGWSYTMGDLASVLLVVVLTLLAATHITLVRPGGARITEDAEAGPGARTNSVDVRTQLAVVTLTEQFQSTLAPWIARGDVVVTQNAPYVVVTLPEASLFGLDEQAFTLRKEIIPALHAVGKVLTAAAADGPTLLAVGYGPPHSGKQEILNNPLYLHPWGYSGAQAAVVTREIVHGGPLDTDRIRVQGAGMQETSFAPKQVQQGWQPRVVLSQQQANRVELTVLLQPSAPQPATAGKGGH